MTYILVWYDFPKLDGPTKGDNIQDKMRIDMISIRLLQTAYLHITDTCKQFSDNSKPKHALLASKRCLIDLQKVPF